MAYSCLQTDLAAANTGGGTVSLTGTAEASSAEQYDSIRSSNSGYKSVCRECGGSSLVTDWEAGDVVCSDCGLVHQDRVIDPGQEWRTFDDDEQKSGRAARTTALAELMEEKDSIQIGSVGYGMKQSALSSTAFKHGGRRSQHDQVVLDINRELANIASKLPGEVYDNIRMQAVRLFLQLWEETDRKLQRTPSMAAATLWMVCYLTRKPFTELDFVRALAGTVDDPQKKFKAAKRLIRIKLNEEKVPAMRQLAERIRDSAAGDEATQLLDLFRRWVQELGAEKAAAYRTAELAKQLVPELKRHPVCNIATPVMCQALALYIASTRPDAPAEERRVTPARAAQTVGVDAKKLDVLSKRMVPYQNQILSRLQRQAEGGAAAAAGPA